MIVRERECRTVGHMGVLSSEENLCQSASHHTHTLSGPPRWSREQESCLSSNCPFALRPAVGHTPPVSAVIGSSLHFLGQMCRMELRERHPSLHRGTFNLVIRDHGLAMGMCL